MKHDEFVARVRDLGVGATPETARLDASAELTTLVQAVSGARSTR